VHQRLRHPPESNCRPTRRRDIVVDGDIKNFSMGFDVVTIALDFEKYREKPLGRFPIGFPHVTRASPCSH
jgi:hypothetical protein